MSDSINFVTSNLVCSFYGCISINTDKQLLSFGKNSNGYLGIDKVDTIIHIPKQIPNLKEIKMVDCGFNHTVCIDYDGNLFTFGNNELEQLGIGKDKTELYYTHIPQQIINIPPIDFISCGSYFTMCITNDKNIYSFGNNIRGQLGIGNHKKCLTPKLIPGLNDIEFIACGCYHTICKTYSNEYYSWGDNSYGQLGHGTYKNCEKPNKCTNWPDTANVFKCGSSHSLLLTSTGHVYSFGYNYFGQLGLNDKNIESINVPTLINSLPLIKRIECGKHSMCIDINDNLWVFGNNIFGQLGLGDKKNRYKPILNKSLHDIIDISSGGYHTFVKTINNKIYAFGSNQYSQLAIKPSSRAYHKRPVRVFKNNEDIWVTNIRSKQKSARK